MFWIFDENSGDDTQKFLVVAKQCLHKAKDFSTSCAALLERRLRVHTELGGDTARAADSEWLKGCPIPCGFVLNNKSWAKEEGREVMFGVMAFVFPRNHYA